MQTLQEELNPWPELKALEIQLTDNVAADIAPEKTLVAKFRELLESCVSDLNAQESVCYHGSRPLLAQLDNDIPMAIHHREIEVRLVSRLYELEEESPVPFRRGTHRHGQLRGLLE